MFYQAATELGFFESVYLRAMAIALEQNGLRVSVEVGVPVFFRGTLVGNFRADLMVEQKVIFEWKAAERITKAHEAQLLRYLHASQIEVGLILNFGQVAKARRMQFAMRLR